MKKNIIGHMTAPAEAGGSALRRLDLLSKLLCLVLALVIWLSVDYLSQTDEQTEEPPQMPYSQTGEE